MYERPICKVVRERLADPRRFIQIVIGPRQTGKTTLVQQALAATPLPHHSVSADEPMLRDRAWLVQAWESARKSARDAGDRGAILAVDEVQKIQGWSETVKKLWDEDSMSGLPLRVVLLGSSPLLMQNGLTESLTGRFETIPVTHWSFAEMRDAFGWPLERYIYFGGYPGSAPLVDDERRWRSYLHDALIETTISRDILLLTRVDKPALLRRLFQLGCAYSGQILSYTKMLGQLQEKGNTTTLAHYLDLLSGAGMVTGLPKYVGSQVRRRGSSPKLQVQNTGLMAALSDDDFETARRDPGAWGRFVESSVGAHLLCGATQHGYDLFYWRDRGREVDFVAKQGRRLLAIEVKSGRRRSSMPGMTAFLEAFPECRPLLVGGDGIDIERFLSTPVGEWFD